MNDYSKEFDELLYEPLDPDGHLVDAPNGNLEVLPISKRWLNADIALHVYLRVRSRLRESEAQNLHLMFVRDFGIRPSLLQKLGFYVPPDSIFQRTSCWKRDSGVDGTVFVYVGELGEAREEMVRSIVGLRVLDNPPNFWSLNSMQGTGTPCGICGKSNEFIKIGRRFVDGKVVPSVGHIPIRENKLPDEMVQRGAQIMDNVTADDTEADREWLVKWWVETHDVPRAVKPVVYDSAPRVRFNEDAKFMVERVAVLTSPLNLSPDSI